MLNNILDVLKDNYSPKFNGYADFDECKFCDDKFTTKCYPTCNTYKTKQAIMQLNKNILNRCNKSQIYLLNKRFEAQLHKYSYIDMLPEDAITWTNTLDSSIIGCVINREEWFGNGPRYID